jgi:putative membrane protein
MAQRCRQKRFGGRAAPRAVCSCGGNPQARRFGESMQIPIIAMNFIYAILGVVLMYVTYRVIDILTPQMDFHEELKKGNIAVAIFLAAIFIAIGMIVGRALN